MQSSNKSSKRRKGDRKGKSHEKHHERFNHKNQNGSVNKQYDFGVLKSLFQGFSSTAAAKFTSGLGGNSESDKKQAGATAPGNFDIYLFAQSWAPRFCCTNTKKCKKEGMDNTDDLSPHGSDSCCFKNYITYITFSFPGVWPAFVEPDKSGRTYPAYCQSAPDKGGRAEHEW